MDAREPTPIRRAGSRSRDPADEDPERNVGLDDNGDDTPRLRRFPRLITPSSARRHSPRQLAVLVSVGLVCLIVVAVVGSRLVRGVVQHVHADPGYRVSYREIVLDPPPPAWFRGGAIAFLDRVWACPGGPRDFSTLDLDTSRLALVFRRCAWVEKVERVEVAHPRRVAVRLDYRTPVAVARGPDGTEAWIDRHGVLLPPDDIDREAVAPVVGLHGYPLPADPRFGEVWNRADSAAGVDRPDPQVVEAAALAGFLQERLPTLGRGRPHRPSAVVLRFREAGQYLQITWGDVRDNSLLIFWDHDELADASVRDLTDDQKWAMVRDWVDRAPTAARAGPTLLRFTRQGLVLDTRYAPR